jgi:AcrR family transcriptional regulator
MSPRETIISAAADYILEKGNISDSIRDIAKKIGTSHRMVNYHFGNPDAFWEALANEIRKKEILRIRSLHEQNNDPLRVASYIKTFTTIEYRKVFSIVLEIYSKALRNPEAFENFRNSYINDWIASISQRAGAQYQLDEGLARTLARIKVAFIRGILLDYFVTNDESALMQACEHLDRMLADTVRRQKGHIP